MLDTNDQFKDVDFEEMPSVIDELHEKRSNKVPLELNSGGILDAELTANGNKPTAADIIAEVAGSLNVMIEDDKEDDKVDEDFSYELPIFPIASDIERAVEIL